jgi:hypothetical protein
MWFRRKDRSAPDVAVALRDQVLGLEPGAVGAAPTRARPHVWGVLMETGYPEAVATLVVLADGTTSLYFSNGGGVIGAGAHQTVRTAGEKLLAAGEAHFSAFTPAIDHPLPGVGRVRFILRTFDKTMATEAAEADLGGGRHPLSRLFYAAHGVITAVREASPAGT